MFPFLLPFLLVKYGEITIFCPKFCGFLAAGAVGAAATDPGLPGVLLGVDAQSGDGCFAVGGDGGGGSISDVREELSPKKSQLVIDHKLSLF